jgi:hypothetical protein
MKVNQSAITVSSCGHSMALGLAWHLDSGFCSIFIDAMLGWVYVAYKVAQYIWPFG